MRGLLFLFAGRSMPGQRNIVFAGYAFESRLTRVFFQVRLHNKFQTQSWQKNGIQIQNKIIQPVKIVRIVDLQITTGRNQDVMAVTRVHLMRHGIIHLQRIRHFIICIWPAVRQPQTGASSDSGVSR